MTRHVPISQFKDHTSELIAAAERGEEIVITRHGKAAVRLLAEGPARDKRRRKAKAALERLEELRAKQKAMGLASTLDEMIAWKNEGHR